MFSSIQLEHQSSLEGMKKYANKSQTDVWMSILETKIYCKPTGYFVHR